MVANNIGHAEDSNRSGKFHGSFSIEQYRTTNSAKSFWKNEQLQWIIGPNIRHIEQIFAWKFESLYRHQGICRWKFEPFKTIHTSKIRRNVVKVSFRSRICRKARNFVEFRRQVFALLLHNTVYPLSWIELKTSMWQTNFKSQFFFLQDCNKQRFNGMNIFKC